MTMRGELKSIGYEIFIGALSVLSIVNLVLMRVLTDQTLDYVLFFINALLSGILFMDFCFRLWTASDRSAYFFRQFGWADLLASVPVAQLKVLRAFRLARVYRLMRQVGVRRLVVTVVRDRAGSALLSLLLIAILVLEFGSLQMLRLESAAPNANITTASDSLWYMIVTMSTVGYGDQYPVTNPGRLLGSAVIVIGVGIFGTLTGYLANAFLGPQGTPASDPAAQGPAPQEPEGDQPAGGEPPAGATTPTEVTPSAVSPGQAVPDQPAGTSPSVSDPGSRATLEQLRRQHEAALATIEALLAAGPPAQRSAPTP